MSWLDKVTDTIVKPVHKDKQDYNKKHKTPTSFEADINSNHEYYLSCNQ